MRYDELVNNLEKAIGFKPTQLQLAEILGVTQATISGRAKRNSNFTPEDIKKLERKYAIDLSQKEMVKIPFYDNIFKDKTPNKAIGINKGCIPNFNESIEYFAISNIGDSMAPSLLNDDILILSASENFDVINDNRVYLFEYDNKLFIRRLVNNINNVIVKSDAEGIKDVVIEDVKSLKINGIVLGLIREFI